MKKSNVVFAFSLLAVVAKLVAAPIPSGCCVTIVAPTTITQPGTYRLGNDISGGGFANVTINADDVQLDLENRTISGGSSGIVISSGHQNITIKNGIIQQTAGQAISIGSSNNISIDSITFKNNSFGIRSFFTLNDLQIKNCFFTGHSSTPLSLQGTVSNVSIKNCTLTGNSSGFNSQILISNGGNCVEIENVSIFENDSANGLNLILLENVACKNCHVNKNSKSGAFSGGISFNTCTNILMQNCTVNENNLSGGTTFDGIFLISCNNGLIDSCQVNNNNASLSSAMTGFNYAGTTQNITTQNCQVDNNTATTSNIFRSFFIQTNAVENILTWCQAKSNSNTGQIIVFDISGINNCLFNNLSKNNTSTTSSLFSFIVLGSNNLLQDNVSRFNNGSLGTGFFGNQSEHIFFRNSAQGEDVAFSNIPNFAIVDSNTGTYTVPGTGDHPNTDNISII